MTEHGLLACTVDNTLESECIIDRTRRQTMLYLTFSMIPRVDHVPCEDLVQKSRVSNEYVLLKAQKR